MSANSKPSQAQRVLDYMRAFGGITQLEALRDIGCMRLASRISELRRQGHGIASERVAVKNRYGETSYIKRYMVKEGATDERS